MASTPSGGVRKEVTRAGQGIGSQDSFRENVLGGDGPGRDPIDHGGPEIRSRWEYVSFPAQVRSAQGKPLQRCGWRALDLRADSSVFTTTPASFW